MPCNGPRDWPAFSSASRSRACVSAAVRITVMNAFSLGSNTAIRSRHASVNCTDVTAPERIRAETSTSVNVVRSRLGLVVAAANPREENTCQAATPTAEPTNSRRVMGAR